MRIEGPKIQERIEKEASNNMFKKGCNKYKQQKNQKYVRNWYTFCKMYGDKGVQKMKRTNEAKRNGHSIDTDRPWVPFWAERR